MIVVFPTSPPPTSTFTPDPGRHSKCSSVRYLSIVSFRIVGAAVIFSESLNHCTEPELSTKANASTPRGIARPIHREALRATNLDFTQRNACNNVQFWMMAVFRGFLV